jgi:2-polyprenyl-3-methyl-5-hydroxy-6-metoxy-1,4-benzoquinol methylase
VAPLSDAKVVSATPPRRDWFLPIARFLGPAYLRNAFTKGTEQEVEFLVGALGLEAGQRVLDVGCGPGRHALALARRGIEVVGVDLSADFVELARNVAAAEQLPATFDVLDVRDLAFDAEFDAAVCLCQGGFGLLGGRDDPGVIERIVRAVRPGGGVAVSAFSSYFALRHQEEGESFDPATGVHHEVATIRDASGEEREFEMWTTCFTARELALVAEAAGLQVDAVYGVTPGAYEAAPPALDQPEILLLGRREVHAGTV